MPKKFALGATIFPSAIVLLLYWLITINISNGIKQKTLTTQVVPNSAQRTTPALTQC